MAEQYLFWMLLVGVAVGAAATWFIVGHLPRRSDDVSAAELAAEAQWISHVIEERGGVAPPALVEEILELHLDYMAGPPLELDDPAALSPVDDELRSQPRAAERDRPDRAARRSDRRPRPGRPAPR